VKRLKPPFRAAEEIPATVKLAAYARIHAGAKVPHPRLWPASMQMHARRGAAPAPEAAIALWLDES